MEISQDLLVDYIEILESFLEDLPSKPRQATETIIEDLRRDPDVEQLLRIQDDLDTVAGMNNVDSFTRNEIMNVITGLEELINS